MTQNNPRAPLPFLRPLTLPLRLVPGAVHSRALAVALNRVMKDALAEGELDFLAGRCVSIKIDDVGVEYRLGLSGGKICGYGEQVSADAAISGNLHEFMLLAAHREDADTLFFQRRLRMSGDTELGLYLKNFFDAFEPPARYAPLVKSLDRLVDLRLPGCS